MPPAESFESDLFNVGTCRRILKQRIANKSLIDTSSSEFLQLLGILKRTVEFGESDSVLLIGPHGCGKTASINEALKQLESCCKNKNYIVINLNGLIHIDDNLALKDIIRQLNMESVDSDELTGSFSDNLQYLIQSLRDSEEKISSPLLFILEEFHHFCSHRNQTLLYNLFDCVQSSQSICVVGVTTRLDVTEMLEKRVKSRFSHRQLFLFDHPTSDQRIASFKQLLTFSEDSFEDFDPVFLHCWNEHIENLCLNNTVIRLLKRQLELDSNEAKFRSFLMLLVSRMTKEHNLLDENDVNCVYQNLYKDDKVLLLQGLSVLEICLIIAMSHQHEIFDGEPFNFEMIIGRYLKFANHNSAVQITQRPVILKAFERIKSLELILPVGASGKSIQKEFQLYNFLLTKEQVTSAVNHYTGIPTDVAQWANNNFM